MKQHEAVIKIMEQNGGFATLGHLNQQVLKVPDVEWNTKKGRWDTGSQDG